MPFDSRAYNLGQQLQRMHIDADNFRTRMRSLAATVCDASLDDQSRLRALMLLDSEFYKSRVRMHSAAGSEPTKIDLAKKAAEKMRLEKIREARIAAGLRTRPRRKVYAQMAVVEAADTLAGGWCTVCGKPISASTRGRARQYCSPAHRQEAFRQRAAAHG